MLKTSCGLLVYRINQGRLEVLLVHPGGPYFRGKDAGAWTVPKGEPNAGEEPLRTAQREFQEETGWQATGSFHPLSPVTQKGGKVVYAWAVAGDFDVTTLVSNHFSIEWPPGSGRVSLFPEVDRAAFFDIKTARQKINPAQAPFITELENLTRAN